MDAHAFMVIRQVFGSGQIMLLEYQELSNKSWEPIIIGIAPLDATEDVERWRISHLYYESADHGNPTKVRDIEKQQKWTERWATR